MTGQLTQAEVTYVSFDGSTTVRAQARRPDRYRFFTRKCLTGPLIPRGAGLSYVAASFGGGATVIEHRSLNRLLDFDEVGMRVRVESGMSLGELHAFLAPRGFFLPVQPGHPSITVGGCVATDAHGKGHARHGTFSNQVLGLSLFHPNHGILELSHDKDSALFELTCGGYGLTGNILSVDLQVQPIRGPLQRSRIPVNSLAELPSALLAAEREWDFVYSWHDLLARGPRFGRGFLEVSRFLGTRQNATRGDQVRTTSLLTADRRRRLPIPLFQWPSAWLMNFAYMQYMTRHSATDTEDLFMFQFPIRTREFYFYLFGRRGFFEHQVLIPADTFATWSDRLKSKLRTLRIPITLGSGKFFAGPYKLLRFSGDGVCFSINVPGTRGAASFLTFLDDLALEVGARPNIVKDSRLSRDVVATTYPEYEHFRAGRRAVDPDATYRSELSERLGL
jgi:decaprenylphospho-beta-D-ribofuranose 2-oxidase